MRGFYLGFCVGAALALQALAGCGGKQVLATKKANGGTGGANNEPAPDASPAPACVDSTRHTPASLKRCKSDADCATVVVPDCCSMQRVSGITLGQDCTLSSPVCDGILCSAPSGYAFAEDGSISVDGTVDVRCVRGDGGDGECFTDVAPAHAGIVCGTSLCGAGSVCLHGLFPPPACVQIPSSCGGQISCDCFPPDLCGVSLKCSDTLGTDVFCDIAR
jgi:hypothetical protein